MRTLPRAGRHTDVEILGDCFRLYRQRCGRPLEAVCLLRTHSLGWELVLNVNDSPQRSEVCRSQDEVLDKCERWKAAMIQNGWTAQRKMQEPRPVAH